MNKTVTASLSGLVFHVEEHGYEKLQNYLKDIRKRLGNDEDADEIMRDIESRIAELFLERTSERKEVVTDLDVEQVISIMGSPEEFGDSDNTESDTYQSHDYQTSGNQSRKIYRDSDNAMLGGVCSGIANYFGWDATWVRLAFLGLFFLLGTGGFLYLALWLVLPIAQTTAEKLEMKGEQVNASSIKEHFKKFQNEVEALGNKRNTQKIKDAGNQILSRVGTLLGFMCLGIAMAMVIVLGYWLVSKDFLISVTNSGVNGISMNDFMEIALTPTQNLFVAIGVVAFLLGPIIGLLSLFVKFVFRPKASLKAANITSATLWAIGSVILALMFVDIARDHSAQHVKKDREFVETSSNLIEVDIFDDIHFSNDFTDSDQYFFELLKKDGDEVHVGWPKMDIHSSESGQIELIVQKFSRGRTKKDAIYNAESIRYPVQVRHGKILVSPYFSYDLKSRYKSQDVNVILKVPEGMNVKLSDKMARVLHHVDNELDVDDHKLAGKTWVMRNDQLQIQKLN